MITLNKTTNLTGVSKVEVDGKEVQVAIMGASIGPSGKFNTNRTIQNPELFELEKDEVLKDFAAFDDYVYSVAEQEGENWKGGANAESTQ